MRQSIPFGTTDLYLAMCLDMVGCKRFQPESRLDIANVYSPAVLERINREEVNARRAPFKNCQEAHKAGRRGNVIYFFERTPALAKCRAAFYDEKRRNSQAKPDQKLETASNISQSDAVRLVISGLMLLKDFQQLWKTATPWYQRGGEATNNVKESITVDEEMLAEMPADSGYKVGDKINIEGSTDFSALDLIHLYLPKEKRAEIGL